MKGYIHSVETFGTVDGPGIRYVIFFRGCPLRCKYCHNPDTWASGGEEKSAEELIADAERYRAFLKGGGITATGGEPLLQAEFLARLFDVAHRHSFHTCLDTSGAVFSERTREQIGRVIASTDLVLLDIKHIDDAAHRKLTGSSNAPVLDFARYLSAEKVPVWIRHVVVPGITDGEADARALGRFLGTLGNVKALDVLPYHTMGVGKYRQLGLPYALEGVPPATEEQALRVREWILQGRKEAKGGAN